MLQDAPRRVSPMAAVVTCGVLLASLLVLYFPRLEAATVDITYPLSGGIAIFSASGTVPATVTGHLLGVPFSLSRTGVVSGATSWNVAGDLTLSFGQGEDAPSLGAGNRLDLTRRAGSVVIDFPLVSIGRFDPLDIDIQLFSNDSSARITNSDVLVDGDGVGGGLTYEAERAIQMSGPLLMQVSGAVDFPGVPPGFPIPVVFGAYFAAQNASGGSSAAVVPLEGNFNEALIESFSGCQRIPINECALDYTVTYDFTGVTSTVTATAAAGASTAYLPVPHPIPLPPALWLLAPAVGALGLMRKKSGRRTRLTARTSTIS